MPRLHEQPWFSFVLTGAGVAVGLAIGAAWPRLSGPAATQGPSDGSERSMLRALGYVDGRDRSVAPGPCGVQPGADPAIEGPDLVLFGMEALAVRLTPEGTVHTVHLPGPRSGVFITRYLPLEDGGALLLLGDGALERVGPDGAVAWRREGHFHHDVVRLDADTVLVLDAQAARHDSPIGHQPFVDDGVVWMGLDGEVKHRVSVTSVLIDRVPEAQWAFLDPTPWDGETWDPMVVARRDLLHTNGVQAVRGRIPACGGDDVLVMARNLDTLACLSMDGALTWSWTGEVEAPHDPVVLADGRVQVFDNGRRSDRSRVVVVDPATGTMAVAVDGEDDGMYTDILGSSTAPDDHGHRVVVSSTQATVHVANADGDLAWSWRACPPLDGATIQTSVPVSALEAAWGAERTEERLRAPGAEAAVRPSTRPAPVEAG